VPAIKRPIEPEFPKPTFIGGRRKWRLQDIINYERSAQGLPAETFGEDEQRWLSGAQVRRRLGVSDQWIWRKSVKAYRTESPTVEIHAA
jgi:hypothetical protein